MLPTTITRRRTTSSGSVRRTMLILLLLVVVIGVAGILVWRNRTSSDPEALFYSALRQNLTETGVTCTIAETTDTVSSKQATSLDLVSKNKLRSIVDTNPNTSTSVKLEEIDLPSGIFVRYTSISTTQKNADGATPDFSKVLHVWAKTTPPEQLSSLFGRTAFGNCIVPLAHLTGIQASGLQIKLQKSGSFKVDFTKSKIWELDGVEVREYTVAVQPRPYINFMKQVAQAYGLKDLDAIDVASFDTKKPENMKFYVRSDSGRLHRIDYTTKRRTVTFVDYGKVPQVSAPKTFISPEELQKRLVSQ